MTSFNRVATTLTLLNSGRIIVTLQQAVNGTTPNPNVGKVSLAGTYQGAFQGLPSITVTVTADTIGFRGCNTNSLPYEALENGQFRISGPGISTLVFCSDDRDSEYVNLLNSVTSFTRSANSISLISNGRTVITLNHCHCHRRNHRFQRMQLELSALRSFGERTIQNQWTRNLNFDLLRK